MDYTSYVTTQAQTALAPLPAPQVLALAGDLLLHRELLAVALRRHPATRAGRAAAWAEAGWVAANDTARDALSASLLARVPSPIEAEHEAQVVARLAVIDAIRDAGREALGLPDTDDPTIDAAILGALADTGSAVSTQMLVAAWEALNAQAVYPEAQTIVDYLTELLG